MNRESRLDTEIRRLLQSRRTASLGTSDAQGRACVSMTPFAIDTITPRLVLLVSGLAAHTDHIRRDSRVSLLIADAEAPQIPVHALARITLFGVARIADPADDESAGLRQCYLQRFPEAAPIAELPDFRYVAVYVQAVRQVAGFGAARDVSAHDFERLVRPI